MIIGKQAMKYSKSNKSGVSKNNTPFENINIKTRNKAFEAKLRN